MWYFRYCFSFTFIVWSKLDLCFLSRIKPCNSIDLLLIINNPNAQVERQLTEKPGSSKNPRNRHSADAVFADIDVSTSLTYLAGNTQLILCEHLLILRMDV